jgi:phosphatidate cytidylyltransferase
LSLGGLDCTPDPIFTPATYTLQDLQDLMPAQALELARLAAQQLPPGLVSQLVGLKVVMKPIAVHAMVLAVFASLVAPFGEFVLGAVALSVSV